MTAYYEQFDLTHTQKRILMVLRRYWRWYEGNCWKSFDKLAADIHRSRADTVKAVHSLRDMGALYYSPAVDDEGIPCGSGYFLTRGWDI